MKSLAGRTAFLTGAAAGIGRELAVTLAGAGCHLFLVDRDEAGLQQLQQQLAGQGVSVWTAVCDLSDSQAVDAVVLTALRQTEVVRFLTLDTSHPGSVIRCLDRARDNAKAVRTALSREAWTAINRAWLVFENRNQVGDTAQTLSLVEAVKNETRGFEGAVHQMLRNQSHWFIRLGQAVERADNTARLLDVKYHILLPEGEAVGGVVDRDQWTTILQTVSAVTAYRWLYSDGLTPANVIDLLIANRDLIVVRNGVMLLAVMVVAINFVVDLLYAVIDPRLQGRDSA